MMEPIIQKLIDEHPVTGETVKGEPQIEVVVEPPRRGFSIVIGETPKVRAIWSHADFQQGIHAHFDQLDSDCRCLVCLTTA